MFSSSIYFSLSIAIILIFTSLLSVIVAASAQQQQEQQKSLYQTVTEKDFVSHSSRHHFQPASSPSHHRFTRKIVAAADDDDDIIMSSPFTKSQQQTQQQQQKSSRVENRRSADSLSPSSSSSSSSSSAKFDDSATDENDFSNLASVIFMHRHGARTSARVINGLPDWNGCILSEQGILMAESLGRFLRARYNFSSPQNGKKRWPHFPKQYDPAKVDSWSTDFERTIRTGTAVLSAMFAYNETLDGPREPGALKIVAPYLQHAPRDVDFNMGFYFSWPAAQLHLDEINAWYPDHTALAEQLFSSQDFTELGNYLGAQKLCDTERATCAIVSEDFLTCDLSNKAESETPAAVREMLPRLLKIYGDQVHFIYFSDPKFQYWRGAGYYAAFVVHDMLRKARLAVENGKAGKLGDKGVQVIHQYSAHDITVFGLMVALGVVHAGEKDIDQDLATPPFATAAIFDIYLNGSVAFSYATCNQSFNSSHAFGFRENGTQFMMNCLAPGATSLGDVYRARTCPIDDVERAMNFTIQKLYPGAFGEPLEAMCFADPTDVETASCYAQNATSNATRCHNWRKNCPLVGCSVQWIEKEKIQVYNNNGETTTTTTATGETTPSPSASWSEKRRFNFVRNETPTGAFDCVEIEALRTVPRDVMRTDLSKAGVFVSSMLIGGVFGAAVCAVVMRSALRQEREAAAAEGEAYVAEGGNVEPAV